MASAEGLYKSDNGGMTWALLGGLPAGPVMDVVVAPHTPGTLYAIAGKVVFKTVDGGATWSSTGQAAEFRLAVDPTRDWIVYATGRLGGPANLVKSLDAGRTWMSVAIVDLDAQQTGATVTTTVSRLLVDPNAPDEVYAVALTEVRKPGEAAFYQKVFKSFTGGAYWQAMPIGSSNLAISPHTSELYFSVGDLVYVSSDRGLTSVPSFITYLGGNVSSTPRNIAFNPVDRNSFYVSTDGSWFVRTPGVVDDFWSTGTPARTSALTAIAVDPSTPDVIYGGSACGWPGQPARACVPLVKSFDGGRTWREITDGYTEPELIALAPRVGHPLIVRAVFIETVDGRPAYRTSASTDGGLTWTPRGMLRHLSAGVATRDGARLVVMGEQALLAALPDEILRSGDGGDVFTSILTNASYNPLPSHIGFASSSPGTFFVAIDAPPGGAQLYENSQSSWTYHGQASAMRLTGLYRWPATNATVFLTGTYDLSTDQILKSEGGGIGSSLPFTPVQPIRDMAFSPEAPLRIFLATGTPHARDGRVFESLDGGLTWTRLGAPDVLFDVTDLETLTAPVYLSSDLYLADAERGVFVYRRPSNTWEGLGYVGATMLAAAPGSTHMLYAGTPSGAVWRVEPRPFAEMQLNASSAAVGSPITFGGRGAGGITPREYRFWRYDPAAGWLLMQDYSPSPTWTWTPTDADVGPHMIAISVRAAGAADAELVDYTEFYVEPRRDRVVAIPFRHDGDGYRDVFVYDRASGAWAIRHGNSAGAFTAGPSGGWAPGWDLFVADFNGDGLDDFFLYSNSSGNWYKAINAGVGFTYFTQGWSPGLNILPLDLNGDGRTDVFTHNPRTGLAFACTSVGDGESGFDCSPLQWAPGFRAFAADFNADGSDDLFIHRSIGGEYYKVISAGDGSFTYVGSAWAPNWTPALLDLSGDGRSDVFLYNVTNGGAYRAVSTGDGIGGFSYAVEQWRQGWSVYPADFDLDARDDLFLYDGGSWEKVLNDGNAFEHFAGGWARWTISVADLNGDGRSDVFLFDPASGHWYQSLTTSPNAFAYTSGVFRD